MPGDIVAPYLADGRLVPLPIEGDAARRSGPLTIYAAHLRDRSLGKAGRWLLDDLQSRFR
jgi:DNA-binding transcriptional LysR family regulator